MHSYRSIIQILSALFLLVAFGTACNECKDVECLNGGSCEDGECVCIGFYTGDRCQVEPRNEVKDYAVRFTSVQLLDFPDLNNNRTWDDSTCLGLEPDIYLTVEDGSGVIFTSDLIIDAKSDTNYTLTGSIPFDSDDAYSTFIIRIYDRDDGSCGNDDYMTGMQRKLYDSNNQFQQALDFSNTSVGFRVRMSAKY